MTVKGEEYPCMLLPSTTTTTSALSPAEIATLTPRLCHLLRNMASATVTDYTTWTPEELMRDYHGEIKGSLFIRCMEWYTNAEVEAKINAGRPDGTKIKNSNFYAEHKRNLEIVALRDGHLPTEYKLQYDKRRLHNIEIRLGSEHESVRKLRSSVRRREAIGCEFSCRQ
jgi:hypothetical protein